MNVQASEEKKNAILQTLQRIFTSYSALAEEVEDNDSGFEFDDNVYEFFNFGYDRDDELGDSLRLLLEKMEKVFTSSFSHVHGLAKEVDSAFGQMQKGRALIGGIADVGSETGYGGKAIQHKFTSTKNYSDVDAHIKKALLQLTGAKGETPRDGNVRVADVTIEDGANTWPFTQAQPFTVGLNAFLTEVRTRVSTQYTNMVQGLNHPHATNFAQWLTGQALPASANDVISVSDWFARYGKEEEPRFPNASWVVCGTPGQLGKVNWNRPPQLLVKLRFIRGFEVDLNTVFGGAPERRRVSQVNVAICAAQHAQVIYKVTKCRYLG
jgi:hypothetical protein